MENENNNNENHLENTKTFTKNVAMVLISNILSIITGVLVGFVVPRVLGVTDYGYYKTFTLYVSYIGLFHFGFVDGVYLYFAGQKSLDKEKFRTLSKFLIMFQFIITAIITIIAMFFVGNELCLIIFLVALDVLACNVTSYYEFISQITMRFKMVSLRGIIRSILTVLSVIVLYIIYKYCNSKISYYIYAIIVISINYILAIWYIITYRDITFGKSKSFKEEKKYILFFFKLGFPLLISNLVAQLIFVVDQQIVNIFFDTDTYSTYAFAYTMINLITVATSAISVVIYPTLRTMNEEKIKNNYSIINSLLLIFVSACLICYFLLVPFVNHFLPEYSLSLVTFRIILPGVLVSSSIQVIKYNCYKTFGMINNYLYKSLFILLNAIIVDLIVYYVVGTTNIISIVSIFVLIIWYLLVEITMAKKFKIKWIKNFIYVIVSIAMFYLTTFIPNIWIGFFAYIGVFLLETILIFNKDLVSIVKFVFKNK